MGPVLFLIFINDLPDNIRSSVRLFADDCVLYRNIKPQLDCQILQDGQMGDGLANEIQCYQMSFNEGDPATSKQAYTIQLHIASANIRTGTVR